MARLTLENAWVELPISLSRSHKGGVSRTGGEIDVSRGVVTALRDISFELRDGDRLGLMGHNGAGKTTMLRLLAGAYPPTRGRITTIGSISTLFNATPGINAEGTGRENIITCGLHLGLSRRQIAAKMDEIIDFAELGDFIDLPVRIYSAGMMTRLGFSIVTAVEPEILLLDEGLATGDAHFARKASEKMNQLIASSSILVLASHSETLLADTCTRCIMLEHGRIIADGGAKDTVETYRRAVVEAADADDAQALERAYDLASDMAKRGEHPPADLEIQGLRYALRLVPGDQAMTMRLLSLMHAQGRSLRPLDEAELLIPAIRKNPDREDLLDRLKGLLDSGALEGHEPARRDAAAILNRRVQQVETYAEPAGIVAAAQSGDVEGMYRAFALSQELASKGDAVPAEIEELGLRYALMIDPSNVGMLQRSFDLRAALGLEPDLNAEVRLITGTLALHPGRTDLIDRLRQILTLGDAPLHPETRASAVAVLTALPQHDDRTKVLSPA